MSGILLLVPLAAPAHASNASLPTITRDYTYVCGGGYECDFNFNLTNPSSNQYALTAITMTVPTGWSISFCDWYNNQYFDTCTSGANSAEWQPGSSGFNLPPGATQDLEIGVNYPTGSSYPIVGTLTTTVQDQSSGAFYTGPTTQLISADPTGFTDTGGYVSVTGVATSYTAGSAPFSFTAQLVTSGAVKVANGGIPIFLTQATAAHYGTFSGSGITCLRPSQCWGYTDATGKLTGTFQPSNIAGSYSFEAVAGGGYFGDGSYCNPPDCNYYYSDSGSIPVTTVAGAPSSVGYQLSSSPFPSIDWLPFGTGSTAGTTTNTNSGGHTFTGAVLCVATQQSCSGASPANTDIAISATDRYGNPDTFGAGGVTFVGSQNIQIQTASGGLFDVALLPSTVTCGVTAGFTCPSSGSSFEEPFNYYQGAAYGTAGVMTTTITGTYGGSSFSVSGSSGAIETSTFATDAGFYKTDHVTTLPASNVVAGKSITFDVVLDIAQSGVPVTVAVCVHSSCAGTSSGYSGSIAAASGQTNSSGIFSTTLTVDTKAGHVAILNATVLTPINGAPKTNFVDDSLGITTIAGSAAKLTVVVGSTATLTPSPISYSIPGATTYVNVVTSDAYGNPVSTVGPNQIQVNLVANPSTITVTSAYIPTNCFETNGTSGNGCSTGFSSFGPIAWTLPSTVPSAATISASGVLNGIAVTSATTTVNVVSKTPSISVFSPKPLSGVIYSDSANVQFRGWANASLGYNGAASMSTLGWKIGTGSWQSTGLAGTNAQWSVIATFPAGLSTISFNGTDSKGNVVVSSSYQVLVDTAAPTVTNVTPNGAVLNPGQLFTATIVDPEGDLNSTYGASGIQVTYNGTILAGSAVHLSGSNSPGNSVTYTLTAALPTSVGNPGHWSVVVSAGDLAGNVGTGTAALITVTVAFGNSITFNPGSTYGQVGAFNGFTVSVTNSWSTSQTIVVFATAKSGTSIYIAQGTVTVGAGETATVFLADILPIPSGTYSVTYAAVTTSNQAVSAPITPLTLVAP